MITAEVLNAAFDQGMALGLILGVCFGVALMFAIGLRSFRP